MGRDWFHWWGLAGVAVVLAAGAIFSQGGWWLGAVIVAIVAIIAAVYHLFALDTQHQQLAGELAAGQSPLTVAAVRCLSALLALVVAGAVALGYLALLHRFEPAVVSARAVAVIGGAAIVIFWWLLFWLMPFLFSGSPNGPVGGMLLLFGGAYALVQFVIPPQVITAFTAPARRVMMLVTVSAASAGLMLLSFLASILVLRHRIRTNDF
ncbi:hypothetical protein L248_2786 [Schleiferilactobacillus shenzhenensis LY-73]|uniref:Uncharacterized protein n=2 Tax=Schleiferilactobacillus shenzhenensis TaxID=1231337 RepID=U4TVH2_9LACO|nr:hypothetical protein L248_2786 [Schleiferilactobacillus shenzhenensis LY-73]